MLLLPSEGIQAPRLGCKVVGMTIEVEAGGGVCVPTLGGGIPHG